MLNWYELEVEALAVKRTVSAARESGGGSAALIHRG